MKTPRLVFAYVVIVVFIGFTLIGASGAIGWIAMKDATAQTSIISGCLGIIIAILKGHSLFLDPEAIAKLKDNHADEIRDAKAQLTDVSKENAKLKQAIAELKSEHQTEVSKLKFDHMKYIANEAKRPRSVPSIGQQLMAPGSARTSPRPEATKTETPEQGVNDKAPSC